MGANKESTEPVLMTFLEAYEKVLSLKLPKHLLEDDGINDASLQNLLIEYEEDEEVIGCAQQLLQPAGTGDPLRAEDITLERIIEIHRCMEREMRKVIDEFYTLPEKRRRKFTKKERETVAELLVSMTVEHSFDVRCEDVELAVIMNEDKLQNDKAYTDCAEHLSALMQELHGVDEIC